MTEMLDSFLKWEIFKSGTSLILLDPAIGLQFSIVGRRIDGKYCGPSIGAAVEVSRIQHGHHAEQKLRKGQPISYLRGSETCIECDFEAKQPDTSHETDDDTDAGREILRDVVCIVDH